MQRKKNFIADVHRQEKGEMSADEYACVQHCDTTSMLSTPLRSRATLTAPEVLELTGCEVLSHRRSRRIISVHHQFSSVFICDKKVVVL
jgi:hypothetical protein